MNTVFSTFDSYKTKEPITMAKVSFIHQGERYDAVTSEKGAFLSEDIKANMIKRLEEKVKKYIG